MVFMERVNEAQRIAAIQMRETDNNTNANNRKRKSNKMIRDDNDNDNGSSFNLKNTGGGFGAMKTGRRR